MRKIAAMTSLVSFILEIFTSIVLYITPPGRVSNWSNWRFWGLSKEEWTNLHVNLGILFLLAILLHVYFNWKVIGAYLKNKARAFRLFTPSFNVGLLASIAVFVGTLLYVPPFSSVIEFSTAIKDQASVVWGEPPYGHAELSSLRTFADKMDYDLDAMLAQLRDAGIEFGDDSWTLMQVAEANGLSPQAIYLVMRPEETGEVKELPASSPEGLGPKTVADFSREYGLDPDQVLAVLAGLGIEARAETKFREAAEGAGTSASELYLRLVEGLRAPASPGGLSQDDGGQGQARSTTPTGLGRMTLGELCAAYAIDADQAVAKLAAQGVQANPGDKVRDIAAGAGLTPEDVYLLIQ